MLQHVRTAHTRLTVAALVLGLSIAPSPSHADNGRGVATDNAWISFLKCQDLIGRTADTVNHDTFPTYSMWLRGYIAGVSSVSAISITEKVKFSDVAASVLIYCKGHQKESAVEAAVHVGSLFYNVLNFTTKAIDLHSPGTPPLQE